MNDSPFIFERYAFDSTKATLSLDYRFESGPSFQETIVFPTTKRLLTPHDLRALDHAFRLVFLLAGVSYYKAFAPHSLQCHAFPLDKATAAFVEKIYRLGLGEFSFINNLDLGPRVNFVVDDNAQAPQPVTLNLPHHLCVPIGGGKDSIVTLECLRGHGLPITLFALGGSLGIAAPIQATAQVSGLPIVKVARTLSPNLITLNKEGGAYNGHVPITAILSAVALACSIMQGFNAVVMSNEYSASAANMRYNNLEINHQYSKSFEFEKDFSRYVTDHISPSLAYFSFLRPLTESEITRRFARLEKYHPVFRSCNTAFRQDVDKRGKTWCCNCPKCRFVFLALAPFVPKTNLISIFGKDMLDDPTQTGGYAELSGLAAHKPFECVGEVEESALLMEKLYQTADWKNDTVVANLGMQLSKKPKDLNKMYRSLFDFKSEHRLSERYLKMLHACS